jgi:ketosteroid isomerase-like protein
MIRLSISALIAALSAPVTLGGQSTPPLERRGASGQQRTPTDSADEAMIRAARARYNQAIAAHDTVAVARDWHPDIVQVTSTNARYVGRDVARAHIIQVFASRPDVVYVREPERIDVNTAWGQASESGHWTGRWTQTDGVTRVGGRYFAKWRKVEGRWMVLTEVFVQTSCSGTTYCDRSP